MPVVRDYLQNRSHQGMNPLSVNTTSLSPPSAGAEGKASPISPIIARKKYIASLKPFGAESEDDIKFGINDSAEDHKFTSYHLDYKYTPPIHKGPCSVCKNFIIGSMVTACEKMYCPGCFLCTNCGVELRPAYYKAHDESPYCRNCHSQLFLPPCHHCGDYLGEHYLKVGDKYFHKACFICCKCKQPLDPKRFFERNGKLYCEHDYNNLFKPKCTKCFKPIIDEPINAGGRVYHRHCLSCHECRKPLNPNNFMEKNGNMYCPDCYHSLYSPQCVACKKPITTGDPLVASGKPYHKNCFSCHECHTALSPNNFKEKGNKIFCPDCYHNIYSPKCTGCTRPITTGDPLSVGGRPYHRNCFSCSDCQKLLDPKNFMEKNNKLFCPDCFHRLYSPKCATCKKPITTGDPVNAMGKQFHRNCFNCAECQRGLNPDNFMEKNNRAYCPDCYQHLFLPKCYGCQKPIIGEVVKALGHTWHPAHFSCSNCSRNLSPSEFKERDGKLFCPDCFHNLFSRRCETCQEAIRDKAVFAMGKYYHPDHFKCRNCNRTLKESAFYEHDSSSYCEDCYLNLFAPKCRGCSRPITNQVYLFALGSDWHETCFRCMDCKCQLNENTFYEYEGEPYCEEHYHARICPDCIKMRRAVERYLGQPEGSSSKPESVAAHRTLNLPLSRSGSRMSLNEEHHHHAHHHSESQFPGSGTVPIIKEVRSSLLSSKNTISGEPVRHHQQHQHNSNSFFNGETHFRKSGEEKKERELREEQQLVKRATEEKQMRSQWDTLYSQPEVNWKNSTIWNTSPGTPDYYRRDEALTKSSGTFPGDPNSQFESTFKKEICESITRY